ncbi:zinc-type alcohol dehydrogenase-like protein [Acetobacter aceti NRIC 0242]|uniref:Zinc-type alcohol dehydrogenase-like protein n=1 Tax=Acetobacter aceti NBRC 14818 TaxID=887700 RepID=A0AB33IGZ5_ACEAC|nr:zinc-binding alcohol dehydrogenase family protein [Acetobacter aceti]TCS35360.1 NADPH2:quinone reductase [Acetobacter aceti NBRC 14818]BCK75252.1 Zn-dependent oxidoreductase [Acetobacter aceti NBRC 14818]GAN57458.1 alcohol dehydrogenase [Acetobacter aceti NBRC 14818]GBO79450.1 zinc-type alcohol dehydrogenase-like protein [Acetobacter aceti NRIC 0242]
MRAVGYQKSLPVTDENALVDVELPDPVASGHDLLVEVKAVSVNPVDAKVRMRAEPPPGEWKVLGWDAAGIVRAVGPDVKRFRPGDEVWYAGAVTRQGCNSELHLVDERIVGKKPRTLSWAEAAAMPLTAVTAWEMLFDRLDITRPIPGVPQAILIIGAGGGVGSMAVQLARRPGNVTVIGTASRPETAEWAKALGADFVLDHSKPLAPQIEAARLSAPGYVFSITQTDKHFADVVKLIAPQGRFGLIDDPPSLDIMPFKAKSVSAHWELMFTRSTFQTADMIRQAEILEEVSSLVDAGVLRTTLTDVAGPINAANLRRAHALLESGTAKGKIVLEGFGA